ncbi:MFS general substrate transporter [Lentinus tigrinus ALCF2SS1-7]|uniref:MFS general substrate transporter n=1 Tax=Lentinus tigrinus ALCF2SS1-7 TaxID=1328758 RepID=UPI001166194D|nr:MFS general substrate transporter [Lentinus tigrinus ALCF2SS1-7]
MSTAPGIATDVETVDDKPRNIILEQAVLTLDDDTLHGSVSCPRRSRVWLKIDFLVLPVVTMIYLLACLDLANIGNARIAGLQQKLGISDAQFSIAMTVALIPPIALNIPSNYLMIIVGPHIFLPVILILLGLSSALQGVVTTYPAFIACRFFTGLFSGALLPGLSIYLACYYPRRMLQVRMAIMFTAIPCATCTSGLIAAGIIHMDGVGHIPGYGWLFLLDGIACIIFGLACIWVMPKGPTRISLLNEAEKLYVTHVLVEDDVATETNNLSPFWYEMRRVLAQPHVLVMALAGFFADVTTVGLGYFLPSIIAGMGFEGSKAQLMSVPPFILGAIVSLLVALVSDRYGHRGVTTSICAAISSAGFAIYIASDQTSLRYMSLFLAVPGSLCAWPALATWLVNNTAPIVRRTTAIAFSGTITQFGGILSVWLYGTISAPPDYTSATVTLLAFQIGVVICAMLCFVYLGSENRRKKLAREAYGERPPHEVPVSNESIWFEYVM